MKKVQSEAAGAAFYLLPSTFYIERSEVAPC